MSRLNINQDETPPLSPPTSAPANDHVPTLLAHLLARLQYLNSNTPWQSIIHTLLDMSSYFSLTRTQLPDDYGDEENDWNCDNLEEGDEEIAVAGNAVLQAQPRSRSPNKPGFVKSLKGGFSSFFGKSAPTPQPTSSSTSNAGSVKQSSQSKSEDSESLKRPSSLLVSAGNDTTKRQKLAGSSAIPLFVRGSPTPAPQPTSSSATTMLTASKPTKKIFMDDSSDDEQPAITAPKEPSPPRTSFVSSRIYEADKEAALARSKALKEQAARDKLTRQAGTSARPKAAPALTSKTFTAHNLQNTSAAVASSPHRAHPGHVTPPPPNRARAKGLLPRTLESRRRFQVPRRKDVLPAARLMPGEVINLDSDDEMSPIGSSTSSFQRQPMVTKHREVQRERPKAPPHSKQKSSGSSTFHERLLEVKKEQPILPSISPRSAVQPSIEKADDVSVDIESEKDKQKRLSAAAAHVAREKLIQERKRAADQDKAAREQERNKRGDDEHDRRQSEKEVHEQKLGEAEARQAALQEHREQQMSKQRQEVADDEQNKAIEESLSLLREEAKKKKAEAVVEAAKKKAENDAKEEAERLKRGPILDEQAQRDRDERTRIKKERAARNKQAEQDAEDDGELVVENALDAVLKPKTLAVMIKEADSRKGLADLGDDDDNRHPTPNLSAGPMSLNSAAGVKVLSGGLKVLRQLPGSSAFGDGKSQRPGPELDAIPTIVDRVQKGHQKLGEVCREDVRLVQWKDEGKSWPEIIPLYQVLTGKARAEETLRKRASMVKKAMQLAKVSADLQQALANGDDDAKRQVNTIIHQQWPVSNDAAMTTASSSAVITSNNTLTTGTVPPGSVKGTLGEILPIDALLVRWRREGMCWAQVVENYKSLTGTRKSEHFLKPRHDEVEAALRDALVFDDEIDALSLDTPDARAKVNRKVYTIWPPLPNATPSVNTPTARPRGRPPKVPRHNTSFGAESSTPTPRAATAFFPRDTTTFESLHGATPLQQHQYFLPTPGPIPGAQEPRPTTGGKTMNWEYFQALMEDLDEVWADIPDADSDYYSEVDEDNPQDCYYNVYRVMRRDYALEDEEEGIKPDDVEWQECQDFEDLEEANKFADKEIFQQVEGRPDFQEGKYTMAHNENNGRHYRKLMNAEVGQLEVFVDVVTRTPAERLPPKSKEGWMQDHIWHVKERITRTKISINEVSGEKIKEVTTKEVVVNGTLTSKLDQANARAIDRFVQLTTPKSVNLTANSLEQANRKECMLADLQAKALETDEDIEFRESHGEEESGKKTEIWVERERLTGPRNLFKFSK